MAPFVGFIVISLAIWMAIGSAHEKKTPVQVVEKPAPVAQKLTLRDALYNNVPLTMVNVRAKETVQLDMRGFRCYAYNMTDRQKQDYILDARDGKLFITGKHDAEMGTFPIWFHNDDWMGCEVVFPVLNAAGVFQVKK